MMDEEARVAAEKAAEKAWQNQAAEDLRAILKTPGGRRFIWSLLEMCGLYADTFRGEATHEMAYESGKRAIGLSMIEKLFTADPNAYTLMRVEAAEIARAKRAASEGSDERHG